MQTIVFIHGTGVREPAYTDSFSLVQRALNRRLGAPAMHLEPCYWGERSGSKLFLNGASVPEADGTRSADGDADDDDEYSLALWGLLFDDPFAELELLTISQPGEEPSPGAEPPGYQLFQALQSLTLAPDVAAQEPQRKQRQELFSLLADAGIGDHFPPARAELLERYGLAILAATEPLGQFQFAAARAIVARSTQLYCEANGLPDGTSTMTGGMCNRVVHLLVEGLGGQERSAAGWIKEQAGQLIMGIGTRRFRRRRGRYSEHFAPYGADVILYQTRPGPIRDAIRDAIRKASAAAKARGEIGEVSLIAHSLGGIAAFDALVEEPDPTVRHLITVGTQVPLLYEIGALDSMPLQRDSQGVVATLPHRLPDGVRSWLNIYDKRDFLSYWASPIFGEAQVRDIEVDNRQNFPGSHSAYWTNEAVWDAIVAHLV